MTSAIPIQQTIPDASVPHFVPRAIRFARILVAVDFTESSQLALQVAIQIAELDQSELFLVHAVTPFSNSLDRGLGCFPASSKDLRCELDQAREEMNMLTSKNARLRALSHTTTVAFAEADELIDQVATVEGVDLIVVGANRLSPLERATTGSVSDGVLRKAACPVLIVGPGCHPPTSLLRRILFATDLTSTGTRAAQYAMSLAQRSNGNLTLLHVLPGRATWPKPAYPHSIENDLRHLLPEAMLSATSIRARVEYGIPAEIIPAVAELEDATLLVVGLPNPQSPAQISLWGTLATLIVESECPVLAVRSRLG